MNDSTAPVGVAFTRPQLLACGVSERTWRKLVRSGDVVRIGRSQYIAVNPEIRELVAAVRVLAPEQQYAARAAAAQRQVRAATLVGEVSAAQLLGLALPYPVDNRVTLLAEPTTAKPREGIGFRLYPRHVPHEQRTKLHDLALTNTARTVVDIARRHRLGSALIVGDSALRLGLGPEELDEVLETMAGIPYVQRARDAISLMDGIRESPLESESYAFFVERGIPLPECQVWIDSDRVDFLWKMRRVVGEADGRVKYLAGLGDDTGAGDALWLEKGRQIRVEEHGFAVVRWTYGDLRRRPDQLERRIRHHLAR